MRFFLLISFWIFFSWSHDASAQYAGLTVKDISDQSYEWLAKIDDHISSYNVSTKHASDFLNNVKSARTGFKSFIDAIDKFFRIENIMLATTLVTVILTSIGFWCVHCWERCYPKQSKN